MVDLAMIIFEFITKFLAFWHPWHAWVCIRSDLKPLFEADMSDSSYFGSSDNPISTIGWFSFSTLFPPLPWIFRPSYGLASAPMTFLQILDTYIFFFFSKNWPNIGKIQAWVIHKWLRSPRSADFFLLTYTAVIRLLWSTKIEIAFSQVIITNSDSFKIKNQGVYPPKK